MGNVVVVVVLTKQERKLKGRHHHVAFGHNSAYIWSGFVFIRFEGFFFTQLLIRLKSSQALF